MTDKEEDMAINVALLAQNHKSLEGLINKLEGKIDEGNRNSSLQNTKIIVDISKVSQDIAVLNSKQDANAKYQEECDKDRKELSNKMETDSKEQWKAINANTNNITRLDARAGIIGSISGVLAAGIIDATIKVLWH